MSRSNPQSEIINPSVRWFEFSGKDGVIRYYDKEEKKNIDLPLPFTFIVLDTLSTIKGWHDPSESGITSNEVRDTTKDIMLVRAFKGGTIAEGFYKAIKDKVVANGGHFVSSVYIAFKDKDVFYIGNIQFKGASLNSWVEFCKANRSSIYSKAIVITGFTEGKKGSVTYKMPTFSTKEISADTDNIAKDLDIELQAYLNVYLTSKKVTEQVAEVQEHKPETSQEIDNTDSEKKWEPIEDLDLPF